MNFIFYEWQDICIEKIIVKKEKALKMLKIWFQN